MSEDVACARRAATALIVTETPHNTASASVTSAPEDLIDLLGHHKPEAIIQALSRVRAITPGTEKSEIHVDGTRGDALASKRLTHRLLLEPVQS